MKRHLTHFLKVVLFIIVLVVSGSVVLGLEISELPVPKLYDEGSKSLDRPAGRNLNSITPKHNSPLQAFPDGTIHFMGENSEKVLWSLPTGPPLYTSYQASFAKDNDKDGQARFDYVDCRDNNAQLYWHTKHGSKMDIPFTIEQFVGSTPHISKDGGFLLGSKKTTGFLVDAKSGRLIHTYGLSDSPLKMQSDNEKNVFNDSSFGKLVEPGYMERRNIERPLYVTRTDYSLEFFAPNSSKVLWKMTLAKIGAVFLCSHLELGSQFHMPLPCEEMGVQHNYGLLDAHHGDKTCPEPVSSHFTSQLPRVNYLDVDRDNNMLPAPAPENMFPSQPKNNEVVVYQPPSEIKNSGTSDMHDLRMFYVGLSMFPKVSVPLYAVLVIIMLVGYVVRRYTVVNKEEIEFDMQSSNANPKTPSSKRKKNRKSGKNNGSVEKNNRLFSSENEHGSAHVQSDSMPFLNLNRLDGDADGRRIGKLCVSNVEIAKGSNGTVVLEGIFEGRPVAVKRLVQTHHDVAFKEIQNLIASDRHPNIVRWYGVEYDQDFVYLSLERCTCSLDDLIQICSDPSQDEVFNEEQALRSKIECKGRLDSMKVIVQDVHLWKANGYPSPLLLQLMRDVVSGLVHLHELGIIHRDLKPQNVLIIKERSLCAKLSNMGISRRLHGDMSSLGHHATGCGSSGWQAPEQLLHGRQTRAVDLFSLGCVLFFCITGGRHPFGDCLERDINIVKNQVDLFLVEGIPEAVDLFSQLLNPDPELRRKTQEALCHPLFWSSEMRLSFLRDTSDRVELEDRETNSDILKALESIAPMALGAKWDEKMEPAFISNIGRYRRYKYDSVRDLLRVMRNKLNHYRELPKEIQELLGPIPEGFDEYFASRFPKLLIEVYKVVQRYCREDECFQKYFKAI